MITGHVDHVGEHASGVGLQIKIAHAKFLGQNGAESACVYDVVGGDALPLGGNHRHTVAIEFDVLDGGVLQDCRAVGDGRAHHKIVGILPIQVQFVAVWLLGNHRLQGAADIVRLALLVVQKAKVPLNAVGGSRKGQEVFGAKVGQFGHIVKMGQRAHHFRCLQNERFANGKAGVGFGLENDHPLAVPGQNGGQCRARNPRTNDSNIKRGFVHVCFLVKLVKFLSGFRSFLTQSREDAKKLLNPLRLCALATLR